MADNRHENLIHSSINDSRLIDYDYSVTWNNRADVPESKCHLLIHNFIEV